MNPKSKDDQSEPEVKEPKKKYMFLGYGGYNSRGGAPLFDGGGISRSPSFFDPIFEMLGLKKKPHHRSEGEE